MNPPLTANTTTRRTLPVSQVGPNQTSTRRSSGAKTGEHTQTVDEVLERQRIEHPNQADTSTERAAETDEKVAANDAGGDVEDREPDGSVDIEGPNSV
jgi:hypothetical protein